MNASTGRPFFGRLPFDRCIVRRLERSEGAFFKSPPGQHSATDSNLSREREESMLFLDRPLVPWGEPLLPTGTVSDPREYTWQNFVTCKNLLEKFFGLALLLSKFCR